MNANNYDLIIDTTWAAPKEVASTILKYYMMFSYAVYDNVPWQKVVFLSTRNIFPTQCIRDFNMETLSQYEGAVKEGTYYPVIDVYADKGLWYCKDGHHKLAALIRQNVDLVQVSICNYDKHVVLQPATYYDYEDLCMFTFKRLPNKYSYNGMLLNLEELNNE